MKTTAEVGFMVDKKSAVCECPPRVSWVGLMLWVQPVALWNDSQQPDKTLPHEYIDEQCIFKGDVHAICSPHRTADHRKVIRDATSQQPARTLITGDRCETVEVYVSRMRAVPHAGMLHLRICKKAVCYWNYLSRKKKKSLLKIHCLLTGKTMIQALCSLFININHYDKVVSV